MMTVEQQNLAHRAVSALEGIQKGLDNYLKDKEIRHHKYKRCRKMADYCNAKIEEYRAKYDADEGFGDEWLYWIRFMRKWMRRWLELAEKFKEAK
jgi:hypothetical protein